MSRAPAAGWRCFRPLFAAKSGPGVRQGELVADQDKGSQRSWREGGLGQMAAWAGLEAPKEQRQVRGAQPRKRRRPAGAYDLISYSTLFALQ